MEVVYEPTPFPRLGAGAAVAIGAFDGVHVGHRALIDELRRLARELRCPSVVATFDRHPASVVRPESAPRLLTDLSRKLELFAATGVDHAYVIRFDEARSLEDPTQFVHDVIVGQLQARVVVVGEDFHFGHRRRGDVALLGALGASEGFKVIGMGLVETPGIEGPVSSTAVRRALAAGDVARVRSMLGHPYELRGVVEHGEGRGPALGCPTANVAVPGDIMLPGDGVYAGWYTRPDGARYRAAISIGRRPTFYDDNGLLLVEAHLVDFDGDLYGEAARVEVEGWVREQVRFRSAAELADQLRADVAAVRASALG